MNDYVLTAVQLRDRLDTLIEKYGDLPVVHSSPWFTATKFVDADNHCHPVSEQIGAIGVDRVRMLRNNPYPTFVDHQVAIGCDVPVQQVITIV